MEDNKQNTQIANTDEAVTKEVNSGKMYSQSDLDDIASKVRKEEKTKRDKLINEAVNKAISEYERQMKLTEEQRKQEQTMKYEKDLKDRENKITFRENSLMAKETLISEGIPTELVDFVVDLDNDKMNANITKLKEVFKNSVGLAVSEKLKGSVPKDFSDEERTTKPIIGAF